MATLHILFHLATAPVICSALGHPSPLLSALGYLFPLFLLAVLTYSLYMAIHNRNPSPTITTTLKAAPSHVQSSHPVAPGSHRDHVEHSASAPPSPAHWSSTSSASDSDLDSTAARPPSFTSSHSSAASSSESDSESTAARPPSPTSSHSSAAGDSKSDSEPTTARPPPQASSHSSTASDSEPEPEPTPARPPPQPQSPSFSTAEPSPSVSAVELTLGKLARRRQVHATRAFLAAARQEGTLARREGMRLLMRWKREKRVERQRGRKAKAAREGRWVGGDE